MDILTDISCSSIAARKDLIGVLEVGDEFLYVNGESVDGSVEKLSELLSKNPTETQDVVVLRNEKEVAVKLNLYYDEASDSYLMGIYQAAEYVYNASLQVTAQIMKQSLLDFLQ